MTKEKLVVLTTVDKDLIDKHVNSYEMQGCIPFDVEGMDEYNLTIKKLIDELVNSIFIENKNIINQSMLDFAKTLILEYLCYNFRSKIYSSIYSDSESEKENKMYISLTLFKWQEIFHHHYKDSEFDT